MHEKATRNSCGHFRHRTRAKALVAPSFDALDKWAKEHGIAFSRREDLISRPDVVALHEDTIAGLTKNLAQFERIKKISLIANEFTIEAGELTPTLKVKRRVVEEKYKDIIDQMHA